MENRLFSILFGILFVAFLAGCSGGGGGSGGSGTTDPTTSVSLVSIEVSPVNPSIALGTTTQLKVTGIYSDNTKKDLTSSVTWNSSNTTAATVSNGLATSVAAGSTIITATVGGKSGSTNLTITSATLVSIGVTPTNPSIALHSSQQFTATGVFTDNTVQDLTTQVAWSSSDAGIAVVSNAAGSNGLATSVAAGSAIITATVGGKSGSSILTITSATLVSIGVTPTNPSIALGSSQQFTATGVFTDNTVQDLTTQVTWSSSDAGIAVVSNAAGSNGLATSVAAGSAIITATVGGKSGSSILTITSATLVSIGVTPTNPSIALGRSQQFTATGVFTDNTVQDLTAQVAWSSSDAGIAAVSNAAGSNGLATSVAAGSAIITATVGGKSGSTILKVTPAVLQDIDITPAIPALALGSSQLFIATGTYSDNTTADLTAAVTWNSSNPAVAQVSNAPGYSGLATSVGTGLTTITATLDGVSDSTDLTVDSAVLVSIDVAPTDPSIPKGLPQQFSASGNFSDGTVQDLTAQVAWSSSNTAVAMVSNAAGSKGLAIQVATGQTIITASLGSISGTSNLTVTSATLASITITPATPRIALGTALQFTATGTYSDGTTQDITSFVAWNSSNGSVAAISNAGITSGLATSVGAGTTAITAALGTVTNSIPVTLTVTTNTMTSITITPGNPNNFPRCVPAIHSDWELFGWIDPRPYHPGGLEVFKQDHSGHQ